MVHNTALQHLRTARQVYSRGFTLIELLVVISIIGLLATFALTAMQEARALARDTTRISQANEMEKALLMYYVDHGRYPGGNDTYYDSRNPGQWEDFAEYLVPRYMPRLPMDFYNASCIGCDIWSYHYHGYGDRYILSTYLETDHGQKTATNVHGHYYSVTSDPEECPGISFWRCNYGE